jgi:hypothetical protein
VDDGQLEGYAHGIDDIVDEATGLITPHTMYVSNDFNVI